MQNRFFPFFFPTSTTGDDHGLYESLIIPSFSIFSISSDMILFFSSFSLFYVFVIVFLFFFFIYFFFLFVFFLFFFYFIILSFYSYSFIYFFSSISSSNYSSSYSSSLLLNVIGTLTVFPFSSIVNNFVL